VRTLLVGRGRGRGRRVRCRPGRLDALVGGQVAAPEGSAGPEADRLAIVEELNTVEREPARLVWFVGGLRQAGRKLRVVERGLARALLGIHEDEFPGVVFQVVAIPELCVVREPVRGYPGFEHAPLELPGELAGALRGDLQLIGRWLEGHRELFRGRGAGGRPGRNVW